MRVKAIRTTHEIQPTWLSDKLMKECVLIIWQEFRVGVWYSAVLISVMTPINFSSLALSKPFDDPYYDSTKILKILSQGKDLKQCLVTSFSTHYEYF